MLRVHTLTLWLALAVCALVLIACRGPVSGAEPDASASAPPSTEAEVLAENLSTLRHIQSAVSRIRGLEPTDDVPIAFVDRDELRRYFQESFDREYSPEEREQDRKLLTILGLIPADLDLTATLVDLLGEQVVGFYDDDLRRMTLVGEPTELSPDERITFAHEFTHALQDQHYGLRVLNPVESDNDDRSLAIQALVEGDATVLMGLWASQNLTSRELDQAARSGGDDSKLRRAPLVLRVELLFPYTDGARFVQRLHGQGGFAAVDAALRNPPRSTEQILHPDKYSGGDEPITVTLRSRKSYWVPGWTEVASNTLGELDLRILVEQHGDRQTATRAAAGWGGDRYVLLEDAQGRLVIALKTVWDTGDDADEFHTALAESLQRRLTSGSGRAGSRAADRVTVTSLDLQALISKRDTEVLMILGPDVSLVNQAAGALGH